MSAKVIENAITTGEILVLLNPDNELLKTMSGLFLNKFNNLSNIIYNIINN